MERISEDCLFNIYSYLDFLSYDIINIKTVSRFYNKTMREKINKTINKHIVLENESFFQKSVRYHIFQKELLKRIKISENQYEQDNLIMLLEGNWI